MSVEEKIALQEKNGMEEEVEEREQWGHKLDFILSCVGYAVGFGNVWRFPNLCYENGGGAFLIPYFLFLAICGMPLFFMELSIAQYIGLGPIGCWKAVSPLLQGVGYAMLIISFLVSIYYNTIIAWVLYYLFESFRSDVPWRDCKNTWNSDKCYEGPPSSKSLLPINVTSNGTSFLSCPKHYIKTLNGTALIYSTQNSIFDGCQYKLPEVRVLPAEEFLENYVFQQTEGVDNPGEVRWQLALCLLLAWIIVYFCIWKGVKSVGKVVYVTATFPYVVLLILLIRGATLSGSLKGIIFYLKPDFNKLADPAVWVRAAGQIFYSLGVGFGSLVAMGSYNKFKNNCYRDAVMVSSINCGSSVLCGFVVFALLGHMSDVLKLPISDVAKSGPGLAFIVYPAGIAQMPVSTLWSILFFLMLITLGLDSQFAFIEVVVSSMTDEYPKYLRQYKEIFILIMCAVAFLLGIPTVLQSGAYIVEIFNTQAGGLSLLFLAFFEAVAIGWIYGADRLLDNVETMIGYRPSRWWYLCWKFFAPVIIFATFLYGVADWGGIKFGSYTYPGWAEGVGWLLAFSSMVCIPIGMGYTLCQAWFTTQYSTKGRTPRWRQILQRACSPDEEKIREIEARKKGESILSQEA